VLVDQERPDRGLIDGSEGRKRHFDRQWVAEDLRHLLHLGRVESHLLERRTESEVLLDELERLLRTVPPDPVVEVRPDDDPEQDQLLVAEAERGEHPGAVDQLGPRRGPAAAPSGETADELRRPEQEGVVVLGGGRPDGPTCGHGGRLGLALARRLDRRDPERVQQLSQLLDHRACQPGRLSRLLPGRLEIAGGEGLLPLPLRLLLRFDSLADRAGLALRGLSVEHPDRENPFA
jgi:hypothetical protein